MTSTGHLTLLVFFLLLHTLVFAKEELSDNTPIDDRDLKDYPMVIWTGMEAPVFTYEQVAAYCAPILWFSPDEPILEGTSGKDIMVPTSFPFEDSADTPIV